MWRTRPLRHWRSLVAALVAVLLVTGLGIWWFQPVETATSKPSIAVLPFDNLGSDEETERLAAGITEDIITDLSRFRGLDVMARNSTAAYSGKPVDIRTVGKALNVSYVLEGSIQRRGEQIHVTAQLIRRRPRYASVVRALGPTCHRHFTVQTEVAEQVANRLTAASGAITEAERGGKPARPARGFEGL